MYCFPASSVCGTRATTTSCDDGSTRGGDIGPRALAVTDKGELIGPPPRLVDNPSTWLDMTDLVFVDPVGTGYSRVTDPKDEEKFWGVEQDTDALVDFVRLYLIQAGRMVSPVFLVGESYGGFRAAALTHKLQKTGGISPSGMVLISPALNFALLNGEDYDPLTWALTLPSFAAVNLESKGVIGREALGLALKDAEHYALSDYLVVQMRVWERWVCGVAAFLMVAPGLVSTLIGLAMVAPVMKRPAMGDRSKSAAPINSPNKAHCVPVNLASWPCLTRKKSVGVVFSDMPVSSSGSFRFLMLAACARRIAGGGNGSRIDMSNKARGDSWFRWFNASARIFGGTFSLK